MAGSQNSVAEMARLPSSLDWASDSTTPRIRAAAPLQISQSAALASTASIRERPVITQTEKSWVVIRERWPGQRSPRQSTRPRAMRAPSAIRPVRGKSQKGSWTNMTPPAARIQNAPMGAG